MGSTGVIASEWNQRQSRLNSDGLSPLDVAVLANNKQMVRTLLEFGAREGTQCEFRFTINASIPLSRRRQQWAANERGRGLIARFNDLSCSLLADEEDLFTVLAEKEYCLFL
ncbi:hypothetical protein EVAR_61026_1 [Eumeta japonica]|uniref:Uncharacterized protein n=1 Tax=Eumeta variegata TaxID=151549 RepID=A0A4C1ZLM0_EUMVA|nr:hypothetical protein EVAR_61026_1 [Eumeta japonica]